MAAACVNKNGSSKQNFINSSINHKLDGANSTNSSTILNCAQKTIIQPQQTLRRTHRQHDGVRPNSTLSSTDSSASGDSGCSFGGSSPINFTCGSTNDSQHLLTDDSLSTSVLTKASMLSISPFNTIEVASLITTTNNNKDKKSNVVVDLIDSQQKKQQNEVNCNILSNAFNEKLITNSRNTLAQQQQQQQNNGIVWNGEQPHHLLLPLTFPPISTQNHFNNNVSQLLQSKITSVKTSSNTNVFSDITQYINPEIHNVHYNGSSVQEAGSNGTNGKINKQETYKTVMCQAWLESTKCLFGENCKFAHGESELRPAKIVSRNSSKYKTKLCEKYTTNGICPYGNRCLFIHPPPTITNLSDIAKQNSLFVNPELHPLSTLQQIQINQSNNQNVKNLTLNSQNSVKKCRLPLSTNSQLNFNQQQILFTQQHQQNNLIEKSLVEKVNNETTAWSNEYIFQSSFNRSKNFDRDEKLALSYNTQKNLNNNTTNENCNGDLRKMDKKMSAKQFFALKDCNNENCVDRENSNKSKEKNELNLPSYPLFLLPNNESHSNKEKITVNSSKTSLLRRLNSINTIEHKKTINPQSAQQHFGSTALGREESEIWSSNTTRFVMGASLSSLTSSSPLMEDNFSVTVFENDDFPALDNYNRKQQIEAINNSTLMPYFDNHDNNVFNEHLFNTFNDLIIRRNEDLTKPLNDLYNSTVPSSKKHLSMLDNLPNMSSLTNLINNDSKVNDLVREIELQKLEEYLIASEQMFSFERNDFEQNDLEAISRFQHSPILFEHCRNSLNMSSLSINNDEITTSSTVIQMPSSIQQPSLITTQNFNSNNNEMKNYTNYNNFL